MSPRRWVLAGAAGVLLLAVAGSLHWVSRPRNLTNLLLDRAGTALGLEITATGTSEYRLRGMPRLVLRNVTAKQPGDANPVLRAQRVELELPWSTLRARGADLTVERIQLTAPQLDLQALQRWQAGRPATDQALRIPTLRKGISIKGGVLLAGSWRIESLDLAMPSLHPQKPVQAHARGRLVAGTTQMPFDVVLALTRPDAAAGLAIRGSTSIETPRWQLPMRMRLVGRLHSGADGTGLDGMRFGANARYVAGKNAYPFVMGLAGPLRIQSGGLAIRPLGASIHGQGLVPTLRGRGAFAWREAMTLELAGQLAGWPSAWPALPLPLARSDSPLPFALRYQGPLDLSGETALQLERDAARAEFGFQLPHVLEWIDAAQQGTPLPPLIGQASATRIELGGAVLEGVELELDDEPSDTRRGP